MMSTRGKRKLAAKEAPLAMTRSGAEEQGETIAKDGAKEIVGISDAGKSRFTPTGPSEKALILAKHAPIGLLIECELKERGLDAVVARTVRDAADALSSGMAFVVIVDPREVEWKETEARGFLELSKGIPFVAFTSLSSRELANVPVPFAAVVPKSSDLDPLVEEILRQRPA